MFVLIHLKSDGSVNWSMTHDPRVPSGTLGPGELGIVLHPVDVYVNPTQEPDEGE